MGAAIESSNGSRLDCRFVKYSPVSLVDMSSPRAAWVPGGDASGSPPCTAYFHSTKGADLTFSLSDRKLVIAHWRRPELAHPSSIFMNRSRSSPWDTRNK